MSDESRTLPAWRPEDGCIPFEVLLAFQQGRLPEQAGDRLCEHLAGCPKCERRLFDIAVPLIPSILAGAEPPAWRPEDGCPPQGLLVAMHYGRLGDADEDQLGLHIAGCPECDWRMRSIRREAAARPGRSNLLERLLGRRPADRDEPSSGVAGSNGPR